MTPTLVELTIGAPAHGGHCVARLDGRVVFVRHALPGETVRAALTESGPDARLWRADAVEILEASTDRVESPWPQAGPGGVGGGELGHVSLPGQRAWKLAVVRESFERFAGCEFPGEVKAAPRDDERGGLHYRTRVSATADEAGRAAMRPPRSRERIALETMPLATSEVEQHLLSMRTKPGAQIVIAQGSDGTVRSMVDGVPWHAGKLDRRPNAPRTLRQRVETVHGDYDYKVATDGFWQVHREGPNVLVSEVMDRIGDAARVADLYAGAGLFSLPLAASGRDVVSVEADANASNAAKRNCHAHPSATIVHGDVRRTLRAGIGPLDAVVLDPPRSGAGAATVDALPDVPRIVYVACDPVALARDTALLNQRGYALTNAVAYDLFPMTHHVEAVATFERK